MLLIFVNFCSLGLGSNFKMFLDSFISTAKNKLTAQLNSNGRSRVSKIFK